MDRTSGAGGVNPASVAASVESVVTNYKSRVRGATDASVAKVRPIQYKNSDFMVADLFGRCFLRVCYWVDMFSSMARRGEPLPYVPVSVKSHASLTLESTHELLSEDAGATVAGTPPMASA